MTKFIPCIEPKLVSNYLEEVAMHRVHELSSVNIRKKKVALFINDSDLVGIDQNLASYLSIAGKCSVNPQNTHVYVESCLKDLRTRRLTGEGFNVYSVWSPDIKDIIGINFHPQAGREMKGWHPLLVLSPRSFNCKEGIVWGLPMTTASYNESHSSAIDVGKVGNETSYVLCHRLGEDIQNRMMRDMRNKADSFDTAILVGGNDDFCHLIKQLQRKDKRVEVAGLNSTTSIALRNTADGFIDLEELFFREAS